ncbi:MAG: response regulator [Faecalicatena sp.]|uniref:response regulator transcription factor n=1 Tax=Faecalicatena sp. TaxID=2005360 RepID=UPI0025845288|nr:response regulator [Faecalicatena sp.]MCI6464252.1 response regulator [Faecalicatena sp.]MDY5621219.1 response regulator [Lachnospiraceae bacterium]
MRILIVDDELPIREWLKMSMVNLEGDENEVNTASNGKEAWELFLKWMPDMVITDIKMPKMGGLELLQKLKASRPDVYVVMLTSYSEFEYAREAIKYQANEYVLKNEITSDVLKQILFNYQESREKKGQLKETKYIREWIEHPGNEEHFPIQNQGGKPIFAIAYEEPEAQKEVFDSYLNTFVLHIEHGYYEKGISIWVCSYKNRHSAGACFGEAMSFCQNIAVLKGTAIGFSGFSEDVPEACRRARMALNLGFYEPHQNVFMYREESGGIEKIKSIRKNIVSMIHKERQEEAEEYISELFKVLEKEQILDLIQVRECFRDIVDAYKIVKMEFAGHEMEELCNETKEGIAVAQSLAVMKDKMDTFLQELKGTMILGERAYSGYIKSAIAYIVNNYDRIESLSEVADYVNINAEYFCRLFKAETGVTFNSYLTNYRIQKAVELLTKTELKVYEVAEKVGYSNLSYFSRVFKKVTGVNPFFYKN